MHPSYTDLTDDSIAEQNPRFKAASLGKLGEALRKHFLQYPDTYTLAEGTLSDPANPTKLDLPQKEDL